MDDVIMLFWAVIAGQGMGIFFIIVCAGILPYVLCKWNEDSNKQKAAQFGLRIVAIVALCTLAVTIILIIRAMPFSDKVTSEYVESAICWLIGVDLVCLLFVVCQQGGLTRSVFLPVFFLIPTAYLAVVPKESMRKIVILLGLISACCVISYLVSRFVSHKKEAKLPLLRLEITDFSILHHRGYNFAYLIVSIISLITPAVQFAIRAGYITFSLAK